jgi:hypothetical protein
MEYYLADGIYPEWATFVKTIPMLQGEKRKLFAQKQESTGKDMEQTFEVLQSRFMIIRGPARAWHMATIKHIIYACIILHDMIVEDERHTYDGNFEYDNVNNDIAAAEVSNGSHPDFATYLQRRAHAREREKHRQLQGDLLEHIWSRFGHDNNEN